MSKKPKIPTEQERVAKAAQELSEHFDTVAIFTTRHEDGQTYCLDETTGNWYAIWGHITEWMEQQKEVQRSNAPIPDEIPDDTDDDGDDSIERAY